MLSRRGARVLHGPTMTTELLGDLDATIAATERLLAGPVDLAILTTGIGVRSWFGAAESVGMEEALRAAFDGVEVVARGPKAQSAARHVGLEVTWTAPTRDERRDPRPPGARRDRRQARRRAARRRRADVRRRPRRASARARSSTSRSTAGTCPRTSTPAARLLDAVAERQVDAVTFTSSYAVHNAFEIATGPGTRWRAAFDRDVLAVAVGPVTADSLRQFGVHRVVEPERARLGSMIHALTGLPGGAGPLAGPRRARRAAGRARR